jgi:pSer/pThr/pTyr-binding forkhead associated (FHA) protein
MSVVFGKEKAMQRTTITLTVTRGSLPQQEYAFEESIRCVIGRAQDCAIQVPRDREHAGVSRHHCLLDIDPPKARVRDLGSRNGTFVNGDKIGQRPSELQPDEVDHSSCPTRELKNGDEIRVDGIVFQVGFVAEEASESASSPLYSM